MATHLVACALARGAIVSEDGAMTPAWFIVGRAGQRVGGIRKLTLRGVPYVMFAGADGHPAAILDRCPHRGVPLSLGKARSGRLACAYHGWEFDGEGRCALVPALGPGGTPPRGACVEALVLRERQGWLWAWQGSVEPEGEPPEVPGHGWPGWGHGRFSQILEARVDEVIENFIDCPHTGYVHGGLFRTPADHEAVHHVRQDPSGVTVDIEEVARPRSLLGRLLVRSGMRVEHVDRFMPPATVEVRYRFGTRWEVVGRQTCTPMSPWQTAVHVDVAWRLSPLTPVLAPVIALVGRLVLGQDRAILEHQARHLRRLGDQFCSTEADVTNLWIQGWRRRWAKGEPHGTRHGKTVRFRL
ncbi:MAG: Rieske 2Fe-2S domain-containing protein [Candidatus Sericytochromatia bacterium]|nr:Rieske 2Fe-2S domain-containing protein [Candidatus Sericytochromatia bacterium]